MSSYIHELRKLVGNQPLVLPGASVLVIDRHNRLLLQQRADNGLWGLPGGLTEPGETLEETAKREVYEETGLVISGLTLYGVYSGQSQYYKYPNGDQAFHVTIVFITELFEGDLITDGDESKALSFFELQSIPLQVCPPDRPIIDDYIKGLMV